MKINIYSCKKSKIFEIKNIIFDLNKNGSIGLVGPNGSGKTTIFNILALIEKGVSGEIVDDNGSHDFRAIKDLKKYLTDTWFFFDENPFLEFLTLGEQFNLLKSNFGHEYFSEKKFKELCQILDYDKYINHKIKDLSMGNKRKVQIILTFSSTFKYLFIDEPTNGLDPIMQIKLQMIINNEIKNNNRKFIISSHQLEFITSTCDYLMFLNEGECIFEERMDVFREKFSTAEQSFKEIYGCI